MSIQYQSIRLHRDYPVQFSCFQITRRLFSVENWVEGKRGWVVVGVGGGVVDGGRSGVVISIYDLLFSVAEVYLIQHFVCV